MGGPFAIASDDLGLFTSYCLGIEFHAIRSTVTD
jgi:hypothetical protein